MLQYQQDGEYAKLRRQWEARSSVLGDGERPYVPGRQFPMMLHRAGTLPGGGLGILETTIVGHVTTDAAGIPVSGHADDAAYDAAYARGFRPTPLEALEAYQVEQTAIATLAAERNYEMRRMSPQANAEVAHAEAAAGMQHLPTIAETPIKPRPRGRPKTVKEA